MTQDNFKFYVIGAGLSRTGTLSLKLALEKLLPGKCMHMTSLLKSNVKEVLKDVFEETSTEQSFKEYFQKHNIVAALDFPFILHYKHAMEMFPDAKVILTTRDPSLWVQSMKKTIHPIWYNRVYEEFPFNLLSKLNPSMKRFSDYVANHVVFQSVLKSIKIGNGEKFFMKWNDDVKQYVSPERLLIFDVKEGWEPLCKFLNQPILDEPFPNVNNTKEFQLRSNNFNLKAWFIIILLFFSPFLIGVFCYFVSVQFY